MCSLSFYQDRTCSDQVGPRIHQRLSLIRLVQNFRIRYDGLASRTRFVLGVGATLDVGLEVGGEAATGTRCKVLLKVKASGLVK
jgi:hypothetical protein